VGFFYIGQNIKFQEFSLNGGNIPTNSSHSVIERPELVNLVNPPIITIRKTSNKETNNQ
jgi:hypothetical protein